jgi:hypothetical protein
LKIGNCDGKKTVYDPKGNLILKKGERILYKKFTNWFFVYNQWRHFWVDILIDGNDGWGKLFITNKRIVFIRKPDQNSILWSRSVGMGLGSGKAILAAQILREFGYEYCQIDWEDCVSYSILSDVIKIYLLEKYLEKPLFSEDINFYLNKDITDNLIDGPVSSIVIDAFKENAEQLSKNARISITKNGYHELTDGDVCYRFKLKNKKVLVEKLLIKGKKTSLCYYDKDHPDLKVLKYQLKKRNIPEREGVFKKIKNRLFHK